MTKQLTVKELIALLKKQPQDAPVCVEGCDCYQDAGGVKVDDGFDKKPYVLITNIDTKSQ